MSGKTYKVTSGDGSYRLIYATSRREAILWVAKDILEAKIAKEDEISAGLESGVEIECPGAQEFIVTSESPGN